MSKNPMFNFEGQAFRAVEVSGAPWFAAPDYCRATGKYLKADGDVNTAQAVGFLDSDEVLVMSTKVIGGHDWGKAPKVTLVSESGLYKMILRANPSTNPVVKRFQNWVTREVLPALRKDGMYVMGEEKVKTGGPGQKVQPWFVAAFQQHLPSMSTDSKEWGWM